MSMENPEPKNPATDNLSNEHRDPISPDDSPRRYIIFGAGAVGTVVGGLLLKAGFETEFIARPAYAEAIRKGITIKQKESDLFFKADAVTSAAEIAFRSGDIIIIATKSQVMEPVIEELAGLCDRSTPIICLQNGISNEEVAARRFDRVYAGLLMLSAVQLDPQVVTMPQGRQIALGRYPDRVDDLARQMCDDLNRAGLEALASAYTMAMKWGKLIANLNNATHTITGYWLELGLSDPDMRDLTIAVREEGMRVLDAAGVAYETPAGEPSFVRIREWTERIRNAKITREQALAMPEEARTHASMWQDLYLGRKQHEADYLNGEIVKLGTQYQIPTPYNSTLLAIIDRMFAEGQNPGIYTPGELHELILQKVKKAPSA